MKHEPLSRRAFRVYKVLEFYDRMGVCRPEQETIRKRLKVKALSTVERGIRELREKGWIKIKRRPNFSSIYTLLGDPSRDGSNRRRKAHLIMKMAINLTGPIAKPDGSKDGTGDGSYLNSLEPPPPPPNQEKNRMSKMPEMYRGDPPTEKLWRAAQRWIALNKQALITALDVPKIMQLLEAAGALELPEDAPLPAIIWPPEGSPLLNLAEAVTEVTARKPMGIEQGIIEQVRRQIGKP